ncbi:MAG TPA: NADH-quinone oxidoreductase subunit NuoG [Acidimicrobiales bacterium]|nr:NADH-quinone oxidoreductase subunit NuoG [Acidimicrobiales bacterium]
MAETETDQQEKTTVTVTVDGRAIEARPGELVIAAAERHGVYIPRFCYHPRMRPVGMCRMCIVEIDSGRGPALQPSCMVPVAEGMTVDTESARTKKAQDGVLEFLLINHPLDCPVCDKGGECPLQDQTLAFGPGESRFIEEKRHFEKPIPISDLVYLDRERCILCDRCTRFAAEVAGDPLISFIDRGNHTQVNTFPDDPFASYFSGNTVQICPVGALLAKPYRFRARPWDLDQVESTCTACSVGCRIALQSSSNRLVRKLGVDVDPVNWGWLCDKGRFDFEAVGSDARLGQPLVREAGKEDLVPTSWAEALAAAADGITRAKTSRGPESIAVLGGARGTNEDAYAWSKLARSVLGTNSVDAQLDDGLPAEAVVGLPRATIDQACSAATVVLLAPDLKEELPVLYLRLRQAVIEGHTRVVELSPVETGMTRYAAASLRYRPGEAAALVRALVGGEPGADGNERSAAETRAAELLAGDSLVCVLGRPSLAEPAQGTIDAAAALLEARPGISFLSALRRGNVAGALDMGLAPGLLPGRVALDAGRAWFAQAWGGVATGPGLDARGMLEAAAEGRVGCLILLGADPLDDFPDRDLARRAMVGAGYVIAVDCFLTDSTRRADVVLPAAAFGEKAGTTTNVEGRVSRIHQKVTAPGTSRADWMIAAELAFRLGGDLGLDSVEAIWDEVERLAPSHRGITRARLAAAEGLDGIVAGTVEDAPRPEARPSMSQTDAPGIAGSPVHTRADRVATTAMDGGAPGDGPATEVPAAPPPPVLVWRSGADRRPPPPLDRYSLRLVSSRRLYDDGTFVHHSPSLAPLAPGARLRVNPSDLRPLGVGSGTRLQVTSSRGRVVLEAVADPGVPPGSVAVAFNQPGPGAADLIDGGKPVTEVRLETISTSGGAGAANPEARP